MTEINGKGWKLLDASVDGAATTYTLTTEGNVGPLTESHAYNVTLDCVKAFIRDEVKRLHGKQQNVRYFAACGRDTFVVSISKAEFLGAVSATAYENGFCHRAYDDDSAGITIRVRIQEGKRTTVVLNG
jgi:hypothetical protein